MQETHALRKRFPLAAGVLCSALVADCTDAIAPEDLAGDWSYSETLNHSEHHYPCLGDGTISITPTVTGFTGTASLGGSCITELGVFRGFRPAAPEAISDGQISGRNLTFRTPTCSYQGWLSGSPPKLIHGRLSCIIGEPDFPSSFSGTWVVTR